MSCDRCGAVVEDRQLHAAYHAVCEINIGHDPATSGGFFTCDRCFAIVAESGRDGHAWWHAGLIELMLMMDRRERASRAAATPEATLARD